MIDRSETEIALATLIENNQAVTDDMDRLLEAMRLDKKARAGKVRFVLLKRLGATVLSDDVTDADVEEVLNVCR